MTTIKLSFDHSARYSGSMVSKGELDFDLESAFMCDLQATADCTCQVVDIETGTNLLATGLMSAATGLISGLISAGKVKVKYETCHANQPANGHLLVCFRHA